MALTFLDKKQISRRYALAAYDLAANAKEAPQTLEALYAISRCIAENEVLQKAICNPLLPKNALAHSFAELMNVLKAPQSAVQLVTLAIRNGRAGIIPMLAEAFQAQLDKAEGVVRGEIISAAALDAKTVEQIAAALSTKTRKVALSARTDASLIGGLRLYLGSQMVDASVAGHLSRLKHQLSKPALSEA